MIERLKRLGRDRDTKNVMTNMLMAFGVKGGSMLVALFTTSAYITYFSNDAVLGVWFTILSVLAWLLNFDMGIGNGVRNKLVKTLGENDADGSRRYISSAYILLTAVAAGILLIGSIVLGFMPWNQLLGISEQAMQPTMLLKAVRIVFISIVLQFVLRLITSISFAMQKSYVSSLLNLCTNVVMLAYVLFANHSGRNGSIVMMAWVYLLAVNVPLAATTVVLFASKLRDMRPSFRYFSMEHARGTLKLGGMFLYLQLVAMLMNNTANFLISALLGSEQVVEYQIYYKLFHLMSTIVAIGIVPMWSAITKALVERRYRWLRKAIYGMFALVIVVTVLEFALVPMLPLVFKVWLGENAREVNYLTALVFAAFGSLFTWQQICCYISNGLGKLRIQAVCLTLGVVISFAFSCVFAKLWDHYIAITVGAALGYIPLCIAQTIWTMKYCRNLPEEKAFT